MNKLGKYFYMLLVLAACNGEDQILRSSEPNLDKVGAPTIAYVTRESKIGLMYDDGTLAYSILLPSELSVVGLGSNSIDFSPDGLTIAFCAFDGLTRNLYVINSSGSNLRRLSTGSVMSPIWSKDGKRIAFLRSVATEGGYHIFILDLITGVEQQITNTNAFASGSLAWSPDNTVIAILTTINFDIGDEIFIINLETGIKTQITNFTPSIYMYLRWSKNSNQLLTTENGIYPNYSIFRLEGNGSSYINLSGDASNSCRQASWTPENKILFVCKEDFMIMNSDGSNKTILHNWEEIGNWQPIARSLPQGPDLVIVDAGTRSTDEGRTIEIFFKVRNIGNIKSNDSRVYVNAMNPNIPEPSSINQIREQKSVTISELIPNSETTELITKITLIDYQRKGIQYFEIIVDPKNEVTEIIELNNILRL